jgi:hypothetical protein
LGAEGEAGSVQADGYGVGSASEHRGDLAVGESFPGGELEDFDVGGAKVGEGVEDDLVVAGGGDGVGGAGVGGGAELGEAGEEFVSTGVGSAVVGHDSSGDGEKPGAGVGRWGDFADAAPGNQEGFGGDVLGGREGAGPSAGVGNDLAVVGVEQLTKLAFSLTRSRGLMLSGPRRATTAGSILAGHRAG